VTFVLTIVTILNLARGIDVRKVHSMHHYTKYCT